MLGDGTAAAAFVGGGTGVWSFVHIDDAARATLAALEAWPGLYNIVDDEPAPVVEWLPYLARCISSAADAACRPGWPAPSSASTVCR